MPELLVQLPDGEIVPDPDEAFFEALAAGDVLSEGAFDEVLHPRDRLGKWATKPGLLHPADGQRKADEEKPIDVKGDVALAARLLGEGKRVELSQPREVSTLLSKLAEIVQQARGIPRVKMPQFKGEPEPGSRADRELEKNAKGRVSLDDAWREHLKALGVKTGVGAEKASYLRASQHELNGANVARIADEIHAGRKTLPIFVSRDNYILDGHHQWAATIGVDSRDGVLDLDMPVERIDLPITDLIEEAIHFTDDWGLKRQSVDSS